MITNDQRIQWLVKRVAYLEHNDKDGISAHKAPRGGYWPQTEEDANTASIEEFIGLGLLDYIDAQIEAGQS